MKYNKILTVILVIGIGLLGVKTYALNSSITTNKENVKIIENKNNDLYEQLAIANGKIGKYESIFNAINNIDVNKNDYEYTYYDLPLTTSQQEYIQNICNSKRLSYTLVYALIKLESNFDLKAVSYSGSIGICQISNKHKSFIAELSGLTDYDLYNFENNIQMCVSYLMYLKNYWINQGITDDESLYMYILNSYNMGISGYTNYILKNNTLSRSYDQIITKYKIQLETEGNL